MSTAISAGGSVGALVASVINPGFRGIPDAGATVKFLLNAMLTIKKYDLPVRIYLTKDVSEKIGSILSAMGVKFKLVPVDKMSPPYIFIYQSETYFVVKTVDEDGKEVSEFSVPASKFIEELQSYITKRRARAKRGKDEGEVNSLIIQDDFVDFVREGERDRERGSAPT